MREAWSNLTPKGLNRSIGVREGSCLEHRDEGSWVGP